MSLHITTRDLILRYGSKNAVDGVSLDIREGERVGIIGRNGAGKTSLLQVIAGIAKHTEGELTIAGHVTAIFTLGIGLRDDMTGRENIRIDSEMHGHSGAETEAFMPAVIDFAELGAFIDRPVRTYSTGMKARLAFSMLVHIDPEILIVDEALSVGDANFARKATAKMRELAARGRILIVVSHSMASICDMCTRCIWMEDGKVRMDGMPDAVTGAYIDEVRHSDDTLLLERFKSELVDERLVPGFAVTAMELRGTEQGNAQTVLETGEHAFVHLDIAAPAGTACEASIEFFRLDRLSVSISQSPSFTANAEGRITLSLDLGSLALNYGVYSARVMLRSGADIVARRAICFEVVNPAPHKGGRPILTLPLTLSSERV